MALLSLPFLSGGFRQFRLIFIAACFSLALLYTLRSRGQEWSQQYQAASATSLEAQQIELWKTLYGAIAKHAPNVPSPQHVSDSGAIGFDPSKPAERLDITAMPDEDLRKMREAHAAYLEEIQPMETVFRPGTTGIAVTAGGEYLPVLVLSLRMLRHTKSKLPVEVFLADDTEYEKDICETVLPSLGARCVVLSRILDTVQTSSRITHYQFKIFAILFSSFENVFFLDADAFPIYNPDTLFVSEPYKSSGMILWPDFWLNTASHLYYEIATPLDQIPNPRLPPVTLRASSETGEILISKSTHHHTLLLAAYYNYHGPSHYSRLLSQGGPGEGDKETFLAAAVASNETIYTVHQGVRAIGNRIKPDTHKLAGSAMVQFDPVEDFQRYVLEGASMADAINEKIPPLSRPFVIHANFPKFNPGNIFEWDGEVVPIRDGEGKASRAWTLPREIVDRFGTEMDVEKTMWSEIMDLACNGAGKDAQGEKVWFRSWGNMGRKEMCERAERYWVEVFGKEEELELKLKEEGRNNRN